MIHLAGVNVWKYIASVRNQKKKQLAEENLDGWTGELPLQCSYLDLLADIEKNAAEIDKFYKQDLMKDCSVQKLFEMIYPSIFNFILLVTASKEETRVILNSPNLPRYIRGEIPCMEVYSGSQQKHTTFVRRIFLAIELMFLRVRGRMMNPLSFQVIHIIKNLIKLELQGTPRPFS